MVLLFQRAPVHIIYTYTYIFCAYIYLYILSLLDPIYTCIVRIYIFVVRFARCGSFSGQTIITLLHGLEAICVRVCIYGVARLCGQTSLYIYNIKCTPYHIFYSMYILVHILV